MGDRDRRSHDPGGAGEPGVRLRCYLDLRQQLTEPRAAGTGTQPGPPAP
ncbi:DUF6207 family protein [Streptomyces sp. NPDC052676]